MVFSSKLFKEIDKLEPDLKAVMMEMLSEIERNREESITRREFLEFARQTEENFQRVWKSIDELARAQQRTEQRLDTLAAHVEKLAEAQQRTEQRLTALAEAQQRTEQRLTALAEAQQRTEQRLTALAEAQQRTELELQKLARQVGNLNRDLKQTNKNLGGLTQTVGYTLENAAFKALPDLLKADYNITLKGRLVRDYITDNQGEEIEVNILGKGERSGKEVLIIGESKSQLSIKYIDEFIRKKLKRLEGIHPNLFPVLVTHMTSSSKVKRYAAEKGLALYFSYQF